MGNLQGEDEARRENNKHFLPFFSCCLFVYLTRTGLFFFSFLKPVDARYHFCGVPQSSILGSPLLSSPHLTILLTFVFTHISNLFPFLDEMDPGNVNGFLDLGNRRIRQKEEALRAPHESPSCLFTETFLFVFVPCLNSGPNVT